MGEPQAAVGGGMREAAAQPGASPKPPRVCPVCLVRPQFSPECDSDHPWDVLGWRSPLQGTLRRFRRVCRSGPFSIRSSRAAARVGKQPPSWNNVILANGFVMVVGFLEERFLIQQSSGPAAAGSFSLAAPRSLEMRG